MQLYELQVTRTTITRSEAARIPKGIIGAVVKFSFSSEWEGLTKTVVFRAGDVSKDVLDVQEFAVIPAECTAEAGVSLEIGVYGVDAENTIAIPTMWAVIGPIQDGADPSGDATTDPTLPVWAQLQQRLKQLEEKGVPQDKIEEAVREYFGGTVPTGSRTAQGGEIYNFYTDPVYTGDNPPKEYPGNTANKGSHAQNFGTHADGEYAHAEGWNSTASGGIAHAEGKLTKAAGYASHAEGGETQANGSYAHSEGLKTEANAPYSHAEGEGSKTEYDGMNGKYAHAEGFRTITYNTAAHAEGVQTEARGYASHTGGRGTIATCRYQRATGMFNIPDEVKYSDGRGEYAEIVGGGSNEGNRSNIYTLDWNGNGWFSGKITVGSNKEQLATINQTAPAGFGLGQPTDNYSKVTIDTVDTTTKAGWYEYYGNDAVDLCGYDGTRYGGIFVVPAMFGCTQFFFCRNYYGGYLKRSYVAAADDGAGGHWEPWEWVNPPMLFGEEYRTTERYNGKPVYMKAVKLEGGPNNGEKKVNHGARNAIVFDVGGVAVYGSSCLSLPWLNYITISASQTEVVVAASANYSNYDLHTWIKYYKTTD